MKKVLIIILSFCSLVVIQNCSSGKKASKSVTVVSFANDVLPIMRASCTPCHFPPDGRKSPLNTYDAVKNSFTDIITRVKLPQNDDRFMPFKNKKPALSDSLINVLEQWQKQNMPQ